MHCRRHIYTLITLLTLLLLGVGRLHAQFYPVHASVVWASPQTPYLPDFYSGSRDRLIITLTNRDITQPMLHVRMRVRIRCGTAELRSREELPYPHIILSTGVPHRITNMDLAAYLQPDHLTNAYILRNGQLPDGFTEISVQAVDFFTGKTLSDWHTARSYLSVNKPPFLIAPEKNASVALTEPTAILFRWQPRFATATEYEFTLKELPNTGESPQGAFPYGHVVHRETVHGTMFSYTHLHPPLIPNRLYAWQIRAIQRDGIDEVSTYENGGYSEVSWFKLTDGCTAPTNPYAHTRYAKADFYWNDVPKAVSYTVQIRPKSRLGIYEWQSFSNVPSFYTLRGLRPGSTYEWRVGATCTDIEPVYSDIQQFTLSTENEELLKDCGKVPDIPKNVSQEPHLDIKVGDVVIVGGDYPLTITQIEHLGDGWYAGRGRTHFRAIMYFPIAMRFDSLRINVDYRQIGGVVEAMTRDDAPNIYNTDLIDDGGSTLRQGQPIVNIVPLDFALPSAPQFTFNPQTLELHVFDGNGALQTISLQIPQNTPIAHVFPMQVRDSEGNVFAISPENEVNFDAKDAKDIKLHAQRIEQVGSFDPTQLAKGLGQVTFRPHAQGRYAFDWGNWEWYRRSVKLDPYYAPFAPNYIAPWKLVPCGETDYVTACFEGDYKKIDVNKISFATAPDGDALEAVYDPKIRGWRISLHATEHGHTYNIYALYKGQVIGKLRVVSYRTQHHTVTIVPVNNAQPDITAIERYLNRVYGPVGVNFTVRLDERMRGNTSWSATGDGRLSLVGLDLFGNEVERRESPDMRRLQAAYAQAVGGLEAGSGCYLFVLDGESGLDPTAHLLGEMPRRSRFGYLFSPDGRGMERTIAHELGHGLFTLQHTFDDEYGGPESRGTTHNLMDYGTEADTALSAFQWNIMASPAVFTLLDDGEEGQIKRYKSRMVCIPKEISDAIMNSKKAVLSAGGEKMELPNGTIIKALFYGDISENPALDGSVAMFEINGNLYKTFYLVKTSRFKSYGYLTGSDTVVWNTDSSNKELIEISVNSSNHTITIEGLEFSVDAANFACGDQKISTMELNSFYVNPKNEKVLESLYGNETITISEDRAILDALKNNFQNTEQQDITTATQLQKTLAKQLNYRGKGLTQDRQFIVVSAQVQKGNFKEDDWNAVARTLFRELELNDNDVLVTVPYAKCQENILSQNEVTLYMPGFAYGKGTKLYKNRLQKKYDCTDGTIGKTGQGVGDFILSLFEMCEIPAVKPRVLIQTVTKPGFGVGEDRSKYEFEDAQGNGLTPASHIIAEDMRYGNSFDLSTIKDAKVRENLERMSQKTNDELFENLINLAEWVSSGELEENNKRMIAEWRKQTYKTAEEHYTDSRLTEAVFEDGDVQEGFIKAIKEALYEPLDARALYINEEKLYNLKHPQFLISKDKGKGLTFALNDTWGFKVTLLNCRYDAATKKYWVKLKFDIFDHFGLDVDDVEKFGSMENVRDKAAPWGEILSYLTRPKDERGYDLSDMGVSDIFFQEAADGFCSWFILQHMRGYKPFVTMMSKEIIIERYSDEKE